MHISIKETNLLIQDRFETPCTRHGKLVLADGTIFEGTSFGYVGPTTGEVVFGTGMVGYPESLTDPSYTGQILTMTYPIIGNYGVPECRYWEDDRIHVAGLIVSNYIDIPSHVQSTMNLSIWLQQEKIPALEIKDTRLLTQHIRTHGTMLGKIIFDTDISFYDPNSDNLFARVSTRDVQYEGRRGKKGQISRECQVIEYTGYSSVCNRKDKRLFTGQRDCGNHAP
jgi:carbamoyl-phosphate synthase small subunit